MTDKLYWPIERDAKGRFVKGATAYNKGTGMTYEEKKTARKLSLLRYASKPVVKERVRSWHLTNKDRVKQIKVKYASSERGRLVTKASGQRRLERVRGLKKTINWDYWRWLCNRLGYRCQLCMVKKGFSELTVDHQLPISRGGDNDEWNLQPLCKSCNSSKQARLIGLENIELDFAYGDWLLCQKS